MIAVISDIHSNRQALEAVLADADAAGATEFWCLGDTVGYNADPDWVVERMGELNITQWLAGNHDLVAVGHIPLVAFARHARAAIEWTRQAARPDTLERLRPLRPTARTTIGDVQTMLVHGSPRDPVWEYVVSAESVEAALAGKAAPICFVGHSHIAMAGGPNGPDEFVAVAAPAGTTLDLASGPVVVNPGSVGQPRDGDPRAAYAVIDMDQGRLEYRRVEYDIETAQRGVMDAGLPRQLAQRLEVGR